MYIQLTEQVTYIVAHNIFLVDFAYNTVFDPLLIHDTIYIPYSFTITFIEDFERFCFCFQAL